MTLNLFGKKNIDKKESPISYNLELIDIFEIISNILS